MELFIFARFHAREGQEDAVARALRNEVEQSRADPGCLAHEAYRSTSDPRLFFIHSRWKDGVSFDAHAEMPHTLRFLEIVCPLIDHKLDVTRSARLGRETKDRKDAGTKYFVVVRERGPAWDASLPREGQSKWVDHAAFMDELASEGFVVLGGPVGDEAKLGFSSALLVIKADSRTTIAKRLDADPWTAMGVLQTTKIEPWNILLGNRWKEWAGYAV